jgi:GT2 family glycosyltransferase
MIHIVIPVFNRKDYTRECLSSLIVQKILDYKIIVIDHGSTDGTFEMIRNNFSQVIVIRGDESLWWSGATNLGVKEALRISNSENDFILTLNNDLVVNPDYLTNLLDVFEKTQPSIVGSTSVYYNDAEKIHFIGNKWDPVFAKFRSNPIIAEALQKIQSELSFVPSDLLPGRGTLIPIKAFVDFGLYDEVRFPHYSADEDFSLICKRKGYKLVVATKAVVKSHVEETGVNFKYKRVNLHAFYKSLFSIKSANNLYVRYRWAKKNSPSPYFYFFIDTVRIFGSYFRSVLKTNRKEF